ncbi:MAG TPA: hypothetical protein VHM24_03955 [Gemmatimonadaceae bacterium]|nr:hypothetical protein [Gemmatimonadaceae bacterium]
MGKNKDNEGRQQGALDHAPDQQGDRTRARQAEIANAGSESRNDQSPRHDPEEIRAHDTTGRDRLFEDRQQHDEAEKNSEKTGLSRDLDRHGHLPTDELTDRNRQSRGKRKS